MNSLNGRFFKITLPQDILQTIRDIASVVRAKGYDLCIVGGAVRDIVSGKVPHDVDMVSSATPGELEQIFPDIQLSGYFSKLLPRL